MTKIVLLGEAYGETEERLRRPFVGESGKELTRMLFEATGGGKDPELAGEIMRRFYDDAADPPWYILRDQWLEREEVAFLNVLNLRPMHNKMENVSVSSKELPTEYPNLKPISRALYLGPQYLDEVRRCLGEISRLRPNLIVALGNTACWATLQATNIGSIRGSVAYSNTHSALNGGVVGGKVLPTYHPAGVLRQWSWRPIVVADLMKAFREAEFPELRRPTRRIVVNPTLGEAQAWVRDTLADPPPLMAADCETRGGTITCIGFSRSRSEALVIPFSGPQYSGSYWPDHRTEMQAWELVAALLESDIPKVFQNGLYDYQYILPMGIIPKALKNDTMLLHHSLFPEMQKGLGFLGSIYTNEASWKLMRRQRPDSEKKDE